MTEEERDERKQRLAIAHAEIIDAHQLTDRSARRERAALAKAERLIRDLRRYLR